MTRWAERSCVRICDANATLKMSVAWDGSKISFYSHETRKYEPRFSKLIPMVAEWLVFWGWFWLNALPRLPIFLGRRVAARPTRKRDSSIADSNS